MSARRATWARALGAVTADLMAERGITQQMVADVLGRSQAYVSHRVTGRRYMDSEVLAGVAELLGVSLSTVLFELAQRLAVRVKE